MGVKRGHAGRLASPRFTPFISPRPDERWAEAQSEEQGRGASLRSRCEEEEDTVAQQSLPPWIQPLQERDPKFVETYMAQREHVLRDGAIPAKYKHLMTMIVDALQTHPDGVATIANRARAAGASEAEIQEAVEVVYLFGGTPALVTAMNALKRS
jgi:alkylhydroperoxidase/carboxymuconolactone decarboxylase family protein YurZ